MKKIYQIILQKVKIFCFICTNLLQKCSILDIVGNCSEKFPKKGHRIPFRGVFEHVNLSTPLYFAHIMLLFCLHPNLTFVFINQYICDIVRAIEKQSILHFNTWPFEHGKWAPFEILFECWQAHHWLYDMPRYKLMYGSFGTHLDKFH